MDLNTMFTKAKKTFLKTANKAVKKSGEVYEKSKISLAVASLQAEIDSEYEKIGKLVYDSYKTNAEPTEDVQLIFESIDKKMSEIEAYRVKLGKAKSVAVCAVCGAEVLEGSSFCAKCGEEI